MKGQSNLILLHFNINVSC